MGHSGKPVFMDQMPQGMPRVPVQHPRTRVSHDLPDPLAHLRLEAMNPAAGADGLVFPKSALPYPFFRVLKKVLTVRTKSVSAMPAKKLDHQTDRLDFLGRTITHGENRSVRSSLALGFFKVAVNAFHLIQ
jgi:hypothetical protein